MKRILTLLFLLPLFAAGQCDTVTGLTATGVRHASATISFTAPSASLYFVLIYNGTRQNINNPGGPYPALVTAPLNSLTPSTAYTYTIVRYCTGSDSAESSDYYFTTTAPPCDTVTNVAASVTSNSVSITSTAAAYGDSYVIYYVRDGQTDTTTEAGADEDFQLANLRPNTVYWYQIGTICGSGTTRNTRRSFTTSNSPAYTPSYNFGWQYKRLAPDSTLSLPTMASPSLRNGKNDKAALVYDTTIGAPAVFNPLTQDWEYLLAGGTGVDTFYWSSDTFYLVTPLQTFTVVPEECPPTFEELEGDPYDNTSLADALNAKENDLPIGNTAFDTTIRYLNGYKTWSYFDTSVLSALGITWDNIGGEPYYYWTRRGNFIINRNNIVNMDTLDIFGGTYRYNAGTTGTKPGASGGGVIYNYGQNDLNHINEDDRSSQLVIDNNGQLHGRTSNAGVWGSWQTPLYSADVSGVYLPLTGGTINGYLTFQNKTASPSTPAVGTNTFHFDNGGLFRVWTATGNFYRFDTTGMGTSNLTLKLKALEVLSGASGTPSATTYLRGDGTWATPSGSGSGTNGRMAFWRSATDLSSGANINIDSTNSRIGFLTTAPTHSLTMGSNSTGFAHYNTVDQVTNYERLKQAWGSNIYEIGTEYSGSGVPRSLRIGTASSAGGLIANGRSILFQESAPYITMSQGATSVAGNITSVTGIYQGSASNQVAFAINGTVNQTSTAGFTGLLVQPTYTSIGSAGAIGIHSVGSNEQLRLGYDASNYVTFNTSSSGNLTIDVTGGAITLNDAIVPINGLQTSSTAVNSNLYVATGTSSSSTTSSAYQTLSSTATNIRVGVRGSTSVTPSVGNSYGSFVIGTEALTIPSSGTSALFAQQIIKPLTITSGAGTLTNSASLYVEGAATNATNNYNTWFGGGSVRIDGRVLGAKGADVTAAGDITLTQGNLIHITGNTQINAITTTGWTAGSVIVLFFTGTPTVKNNTAGGANTAPFLLAGGVDFVATANDVLEVIFNGTNFVEIGRSIN